MRPKTLFGFGAIALFGALVVSSFSSQVSGYETFTQATESGRNAHVVGTWDKAAESGYDPGRNVFSFVMLDEDGVRRTVHYANPKPANFEDAEKVVVEGQIEGDAFAAHTILVKCPSKYNDGREFVPAEPGQPTAAATPAGLTAGSATAAPAVVPVSAP